ncbi:hypothetical protein ACM55G_07670 [Flavobacterium sp. LB3P122]|uniref:hypothetical protein n=1 Tax=Flavobacterium algoriphilum TaxID=3398738 RepID=UPI003A8B236F
MRTLKLIAVGIILFASSTIHAQVSVSLNIGSPPSWGPVGYAEADYYYLPDVEAYYDIRATQFIYFGGGRWIRSRYLPGQYRNYDLYSGYKVVMNDYHGSRPYRNFNNDRVRYYRGYQGREQRNIGYSNNRRGNDDRREFDNRRENDNRRDNDNRKGNDNHDNGHGRGNGKGHGRD